MVHGMLTLGAYLTLAPFLLMLVGAGRKVISSPQRISRLQFEGALILALTQWFRFFMFGFIESMDAVYRTSFAYWFDRGEHGLFAIGLILFFLGFFLERRPRPGLAPWPRRITHAAKLWMWAWLWTALIAIWNGNAWSISLWSPARTCFAWSLLVFSAVYCRFAFTGKNDAAHAEGDLIGIEE